MKILLLDESSDRNLSVIDLRSGLFVLGRVSMEMDDAEGGVGRELRVFNCDRFGREGSILHTVAIACDRFGFERVFRAGNELWPAPATPAAACARMVVYRRRSVSRHLNPSRGPHVFVRGPSDSLE